MPQRFLIGGFVALFAVAAVSGQGTQPSTPAGATAGRQNAAASTFAPQSATADKQDAAKQRAVLDKYCVGCHNARLKTGGLALDQLDLARLADQPAIGEKVA